MQIVIIQQENRRLRTQLKEAPTPKVWSFFDPRISTFDDTGPRGMINCTRFVFTTNLVGYHYFGETPIYIIYSYKMIIHLYQKTSCSAYLVQPLRTEMIHVFFLAGPKPLLMGSIRWVESKKGLFEQIFLHFPHGFFRGQPLNVFT